MPEDLVNPVTYAKRQLEYEELIKKKAVVGAMTALTDKRLHNCLLHEYVHPDTTPEEVRSLRDDCEKKTELFTEMNMRRERNLLRAEMLCDPLVHIYRRCDLNV